MITRQDYLARQQQRRQLLKTDLKDFVKESAKNLLLGMLFLANACWYRFVPIQYSLGLSYKMFPNEATALRSIFMYPCFAMALAFACKELPRFIKDIKALMRRHRRPIEADLDPLYHRKIIFLTTGLPSKTPSMLSNFLQALLALAFPKPAKAYLKREESDLFKFFQCDGDGALRRHILSYIDAPPYLKYGEKIKYLYE